MFTGIISNIGSIHSIEDDDGGYGLWVESDIDLDEIKKGQSMSINGICLTIVDIGEKIFKVIASKETYALTNLSSLKKGFLINVERALRLQDPLDGHIVQAHIDGVAKIESLEEGESSSIIRLRPPSSLSRFIASKGSIALDGISLTVQSCTIDTFQVMIIPYTVSNTIIKTNWREGYFVNIEVDCFSRYIDRHLSFSLSANKTSAPAT